MTRTMSSNTLRARLDLPYAQAIERISIVLNDHGFGVMKTAAEASFLLLIRLRCCSWQIIRHLGRLPTRHGSDSSAIEALNS